MPAIMTLAWWGAVTAEDLFERKPPVVGVVNIEKILSEVKARQTLDADRESAREDSLRGKKDRDKQINLLKQDVEWLPKGGTEERKKLEEIEEAAIQLDAWVKFQQLKLSRMEKVGFQSLYLDILAAIEAVAVVNSVDLVLYRERTTFQPRYKATQVLSMIGNRKVLYVRDELDLTDQVITRMDNMPHDLDAQE
jgi:Skp family chaperone for outer membrane proteins